MTAPQSVEDFLRTDFIIPSHGGSMVPGYAGTAEDAQRTIERWSAMTTTPVSLSEQLKRRPVDRVAVDALKAEMIHELSMTTPPPTTRIEVCGNIQVHVPIKEQSCKLRS